MKQSLCLFTLIAFVSLTSAQIDVNLDSPAKVFAAKLVPTEFVTTTEATNDIPTIVENSTTISTTEPAPTTSTQLPTTSTQLPTTSTQLPTTSTTPKTTTPSNNVTTTAIPTPSPSKRSYDSYSFFGGLLVGIIVALAGLYALKFYKNRDPSYQNL